MKATLFKNILLIWTLFLSSQMVSYAQKPSGDNIRQLKIEFVTEKLDLSATQEKEFLPIYNKYNDEMHAIRLKKRALNKKEASTAVAEREQLNKEEVEVKTKYNAQFLKVIDSNQLNKLHQAEDDFRVMLMKRWKELKK